MAAYPQFEGQMEQFHFYNFVFYEVEGKTMYVYCPNCGCEHEIDLSHKSVQYVKDNEDGCDCFFARSHPKFLHTKNAYEKLKDLSSLGEFINDNGDAVLNVYWHTAEFGASNYDCDRPFRRYPVFDWEPVIEIRWKKDGTVEYHTSLYMPMCSHSVKSGLWKVAKKWRSTFAFNIIPASLDNLKGTPLESWVQYMDVFVDAEENAYNEELLYLDETIAVWFVQLHTSQSFRKLFKAGFYALCFSKVTRTCMANSTIYGYTYGSYIPSGVVKWGAKKLDKILGCQPSKLDKLFVRDEVTLVDLQRVQRFCEFEKAGVSLTKENLSIVADYRFDNLMNKLRETSVSVVKIFKYLRKYSISPHNYDDYLSDLSLLKVPYTEEVLFPKNFNRAHTRYSEFRAEMQDEHSNTSFCKAVSPYKQFNFADDNFVIKCVDSIKKLRREAIAHKNCSAGYVDKIINGTSVIFVVKRKGHSRTPYCMLEYSPQHKGIVQNYAVSNHRADEEEQQFVSKWLKDIVLPVVQRPKGTSYTHKMKEKN